MRRLLSTAAAATTTKPVSRVGSRRVSVSLLLLVAAAPVRVCAARRHDALSSPAAVSQTFAALGLSPNVHGRLAAVGLRLPSAVQVEAIPRILDRKKKRDVVVHSETGACLVRVLCCETAPPCTRDSTPHVALSAAVVVGVSAVALAPWRVSGVCCCTGVGSGHKVVAAHAVCACAAACGWQEAAKRTHTSSHCCPCWTSTSGCSMRP
jgi:hypothetical protein